MFPRWRTRRVVEGSRSRQKQAFPLEMTIENWIQFIFCFGVNFGQRRQTPERQHNFAQIQASLLSILFSAWKFWLFLLVQSCSSKVRLCLPRVGSRILVRGASRILTPGGPRAQNLLQIAWKLDDFETILGAGGARVPNAPWIRWCSLTVYRHPFLFACSSFFLVAPCSDLYIMSLCDVIYQSSCLSVPGPPPPLETWFLSSSGNFK